MLIESKLIEKKCIFRNIFYKIVFEILLYHLKNTIYDWCQLNSLN